MLIGIDASRAFIKKRTGIEEYSYQVIKHLRDKLNDHQVVLYLRKNQELNFDIPDNWKVKKIWLPRFWTQIRLSLELLLNPVDVLFIPAHTVPIIHPRKTIVAIHGLEYEIIPQAYSRWERFYMRMVIKNSCRWARQIISVSRNTKQDLIRLYKVPEKKINVIYEGYCPDGKSQIANHKSQINSKFQTLKPFLLFIGRLEERKNIVGIIKAFEILKEKYGIPHKLVLAGKGGHGFCNIEVKIKNSNFKKDIVQLGFVADEEKFDLISQASILMFPTFYEGFGIPALEAQSVGVPVVTSNTSSMPEVVRDSAILVDPNETGFIARRTYDLLSDDKLRNDVIRKGYENVKRFSWEDCAQQIANLIIDGYKK